MRALAWFLALFGVAVALALLAGNNQGTVTLYWSPYRIDVSLNLVLLLLFGGFVLLHLALRGLSALFSMPRQAQRWRLQQRERAMHAAVLDGLTHMLAGRFLRARKASEAALQQEEALAASHHGVPHAAKLRAIAHLVAAESAQALRDKATRDAHLQAALQDTSAREAQETREGVQLRAARWALADRDPQAALQWLDDMPQGAARRTLALRARLKATRQAQQTVPALETARLLAKHRAFSPDAAQLILKGLSLELIQAAHDPSQLQRAWSQLEPAERLLPDVAICAAQRLVQLQGDVALSRQWLLPVWDALLREPQALAQGTVLVKLIHALQEGFGAEEGSSELPWLERIEAAQRAQPRSAELQYLAGIACLRHQLWGKAQQLLSQALVQLQDPALRRSAWRALGALAEQRGDDAAAQQALRQAALL
ncbi:heme biosynthesis protein HemY [Pseudorhodoferax sp. Leaf267]|uniref:heme biosynthesis protein HemY n=1 Tax=Pseudorhodoferax sp. Leaf267 TaxID=1736316 RepID=UPI0006F29AD5|nr:heme biosynthesis HemY N-terminal domain-containing protein [Pseudorhodoferax sp. Leaf267]KQP14293.1 heme biosynthesis protein HemY [Pseudorhodoferax sp. Leaf267]